MNVCDVLFATSSVVSRYVGRTLAVPPRLAASSVRRAAGDRDRRLPAALPAPPPSLPAIRWRRATHGTLKHRTNQNPTNSEQSHPHSLRSSANDFTPLPTPVTFPCAATTNFETFQKGKQK